MKRHILIMLVLNSFFANSQEKVLAKGVIYNWVIAKNETDTYFSFKSSTSKSSTGIEIGITTYENLVDFVFRLRQFANNPIKNDFDCRTDDFELFSYKDNTQLKLFDYRGFYLSISKSNAKSLATDIEKNVELMKRQ